MLLAQGSSPTAASSRALPCCILPLSSFTLCHADLSHLAEEFVGSVLLVLLAPKDGLHPLGWAGWGQKTKLCALSLPESALCCSHGKRAPVQPQMLGWLLSPGLLLCPGLHTAMEQEQHLFHL